MTNNFTSVTLDADAPEPQHPIKMVDSRTGETWVDKTVEPNTPIPPRQPRRPAFGHIHAYARTSVIQIEKREYDICRISAASVKRLHKVLTSPACQLWVELDEEFSPTVYFHYGRSA